MRKQALLLEPTRATETQGEVGAAEGAVARWRS